MGNVREWMTMGVHAGFVRRLFAVAALLTLLVFVVLMGMLTGCAFAGSDNPADEGEPAESPLAGEPSADAGENDDSSDADADHGRDTASPLTAADLAAMDPDEQIEVWVLDRVRETAGAGSSPDAVVTTYEYDSSGRALWSQEVAEGNVGDRNLSRCTYEYDDQGRLAVVNMAYEQYDWHVGRVLTFEYDDSGRCVSYVNEITSQGTGKHVAEYSYGEDGGISSAVLSSYATPVSEPNVYELTWVRDPDGTIERVVSETAGGPGVALDAAMSYPEGGLYVYRSAYGSVTELRFDAAGRLESETVRDDGFVRYCREYTYKPITVAVSDFAPSVVSNPTGFDYSCLPQLDDAQITAALQPAR